MSRTKIFFFTVISISIILLFVGIFYVLGRALLPQVLGTQTTQISTKQDSSNIYINPSITVSKTPVDKQIDYDFII